MALLLELPRSPHVRRVQALIRDEHAVRVKFDAHEKAAFDHRTAADLLVSSQHLLETLQAVAFDDDFWEILRHGAGTLHDQQLERLRQFDSAVMVAVLEGSGYSVPPPPPTTLLVDEMVVALNSALAENRPREDNRRSVELARSNVILLLLRARRQLVLREPAPSELRVWTSRVDTVARQVIPIAASVAIGMATESLVPGTGLGVMLGKGVLDHFASEAIGAGVVALVGSGLARMREVNQDSAVDDRRNFQRPNEAALAHFGALRLAVAGLRRLAQPDRYHDEATSVYQLALKAERHASRLNDLVHDHRGNDYVQHATERLTSELSGFVSAAESGALGDGAYLESSVDGLDRLIDDIRGERDYSGDELAVPVPFVRSSFAAEPPHPSDEADSEFPASTGRGAGTRTDTGSWEEQTRPMLPERILRIMRRMTRPR